jgi:prepilin-type N-terminal cleavage/methylation domain-containing protein
MNLENPTLTMERATGRPSVPVLSLERWGFFCATASWTVAVLRRFGWTLERSQAPEDCCRPKAGGPWGGSRQGRRGFTLVELLVATICFALIVMVINTTFYAALHLRSKTTKSVEKIIPLNQALATMKRDLRGILPTNGFVGPIMALAPGTGPNGGGYLEFYTTSGIVTDDQYWGDVQKVAYFLEKPEFENDSRGMDLVRSITRNLLPVSVAETVETRLLSGLDSVEFCLYDGSQWLTYWSTNSVMGTNTTNTTTSSAPLAVRVSLRFAAEDQSRKVRDPIEIVAPLVVQARTNLTAAAGSATGGGGL